MALRLLRRVFSSRLSGPGVAAVIMNSSHPDRVSENAVCVQRLVPDLFWASMKEEGLLAADYPRLEN